MGLVPASSPCNKSQGLVPSCGISTSIHKPANLYTSYVTLSSGILWNIPRVTCIFSGYNTSAKLHRERTVLHHAMEKKVGNTINATYVPRMMGRLVEIPLNIQRLSCFGTKAYFCIKLIVRVSAGPS